MHIFTDGKQKYLEFLRNLTPQIFLLSAALVIGKDFSGGCCDLNNSKQTFVFFAVLAMFFTAFWASSYVFLEDYLKSAEKINQYSKTLREAKTPSFHYMTKLFKYAFKNDKRIFYETIVVYFILIFSLSLVVWAAALGATNIIKGASGH